MQVSDTVIIKGVREGLLLILDDDGMHKAAELSVRYFEDLRQIGGESLDRAAKNESRVMKVSVATLVFPLPSKGTSIRPTG